MKIWIDILTPKQLLFFEPIIEKLGKKHDILCTSRKYEEVISLAKIRNSNLIFLGEYGIDKETKLKASIDRMGKLLKKIEDFSPNLTISFCSPDAARVAFGLGIKHVAFSDSPHAEAALRLTVPLIQKLLCPYVISKNEFSGYGIAKENIVTYKAVDAAITIKRKVNENASLPFKKNRRKNIVIRLGEEHASYALGPTNILSIIKKVIAEFGKENIVILGRYSNQILDLKKKFGKNVKIIKMSFDGKHLLNNSDFFIGSGGTMTAESALLGIPTITYNTSQNWTVGKFLIKKGIVKSETDPVKICKYMKNSFSTPNNEHRKKVEKFISDMEDPFDILLKVIKE